MSDSQAELAQDDAPPELTREEINNSFFEFDPSFEFDAPQWFDFCDIKALYCYGVEAKTDLQDGEWVNGEDWFSETHEGHEAEYFDYIDYGEEEFMDTPSDYMALEPESYNQRLSPLRPVLSSKMCTLPPSLAQTPSQLRHRGITSALSPGISKTDSPMRSGAVRMRPGDGIGSLVSSQSCEAINIAAAKKSGPQRLIVQVSPTRVSPPTKPAYTPPNMKSIASASQKQAATRISPISQTPPKSVKENIVLPRYMDTSKPAHQTQLPPKAMVSRNQGIISSRVTQRRVAANITKRHLAPTQPESSSVLASSSKSQVKTAPATTTTENSPSACSQLLKQVDSLLQQHKSKQRPVYEPRRFGIKEIKAWEQLMGLKWHALSFEERQVANEQMEEFRRTGSIQALSPP